MLMQRVMDPTWARLGFPQAPELDLSGRGIGIVIIDTIRPHASIQHLGDRIEYVTVNEDLTIECRAIADEEPILDSDYGEHGLMSVLALAHQPFEQEGQFHVGLAPAANFIVLNHHAFREGDGERLTAGIQWLLRERQEWNIRIILSMGWHALDNSVLLRNTCHNSTVKALAPAVDQGILVICSNGNTRFGNIMPPIDYLAVGGYNDRGKADRGLHIPFSDEPFGRNGDGHYRPDVLAPRVYLTVPYCESGIKENSVSYYWGTSGASTVTAGAAAYLMSRYPELDSNTIRQVLTMSGDPLSGDDNRASRIHVGQALAVLRHGMLVSEIRVPAAVKVMDEWSALLSSDEIERALALSALATRQQCTREELWHHTEDKSAIVRKIAISALLPLVSEHERQIFWDRLVVEPEGGVRGRYAYGLLEGSTDCEVKKWIPFSTDVNWTVRWSVCTFMERYSERFPHLEKTHDPDSIEEKARPLLEWLDRN
ncbi:hypothetical protein PCCS19_06680 [Paenibacillus sp. CCS19]|uniref:S8 family serine peptidase n=1 Tax=Paenibacillus sp. CCS19 TaxID=3158387 RepID=UPI0025628CF9|nr:S8 family serine peptidase [Paenibacillus cellulosilyticus]GMK37614.1 hypothetical protein PCCS19_06680 [Paenibacillus cellulosilyticus]